MVYYNVYDIESPVEIGVGPEAYAEDALICPKCKISNLHQCDVTIFQREREDGPARKTVAPSGGGEPVHSRVGDAIGRRDSIAIDFSCEHCDDPSSHPRARASLRLWLVQHKGVTHVYWGEGGEEL